MPRSERPLEPHYSHPVFWDYSLQVGITIKNERTRRRLTQQKLALAVGLPQSVISYLESGKANPTLFNLVTLAQFFGIQLADFFLNSNPSIQILSGDEVAIQVGEETRSMTRKLKYEQSWEYALARDRQIKISLIKGQVLVKAPHLGTFEIIKNKQGLLVPGGGPIELIGLSKRPSQIDLIETCRPEGRKPL
jgi:transcriptional regulator with XRE-family HTH domain